jgi:hypothetical protein
MISSDKIMQKLREIKKTFADNPVEGDANPPYLRSSEVQSRENEKLKKYLPESIAKVRADGIDPEMDLRYLCTDLRYGDKNAVTFRKTLEDKLESLFNE